MRNAIAQLAARRGSLAAPTWGSLAAAYHEMPPAAPPLPAVQLRHQEAAAATLPLDGLQEVKVWPSVGVALAKEGMAAAHRFYLAACSIDTVGGRAFDVARLRAEFTDPETGRYLFSWKRMRQILPQGDGKLWNYDRSTGRLYLRGVGHVAAGLGLSNVGRAVKLPARFLFDGLGAFNAHIHAAWLSAHHGEQRPISQAAIQEATGTPERTQRHYNQVAGVQRQQNYHLGDLANQDRQQETAWQHGGAAFTFREYHGRQGRRPGAEYQARQMPNSYKRRHDLAARGRRKKINKRLNSLVTHGERGCQFNRVDRLYYDSGAAAAKAANRQPEQAVYWTDSNPDRARFWYGFNVS